ncbi:MAG TPA: hypothetical protein VIG54_04930 [Lysobacter sp.]
MSSKAPPSNTPEPRTPGKREEREEVRRREERLQSAAGRDAEAGRNAGRASDEMRQSTE